MEVIAVDSWGSMWGQTSSFSSLTLAPPAFPDIHQMSTHNTDSGLLCSPHHICSAQWVVCSSLQWPSGRQAVVPPLCQPWFIKGQPSWNFLSSHQCFSLYQQVADVYLFSNSPCTGLLTFTGAHHKGPHSWDSSRREQTPAGDQSMLARGSWVPDITSPASPPSGAGTREQMRKAPSHQAESHGSHFVHPQLREGVSCLCKYNTEYLSQTTKALPK